MITAELEAVAVQIEAGMLKATIPVKTDRGVVAMQVVFQVDQHPKLVDLIETINREIRGVLAKSCALMAAKGVRN